MITRVYTEDGDEIPSRLGSFSFFLFFVAGGLWFILENIPSWFSTPADVYCSGKDDVRDPMQGSIKLTSFLPAPGLNEELVQLLLIRDELHTEQDAMLVDIEDLTR